MKAIRIQKIDGQEFVTLTDYLRLKEEKEKLNIIIENTKKEQKSDREHIEELEEENKKLNERIEDLEKYKAELEGYVDEIDEYKNKRLNKIAEYQNLSF